MDFVVNAFLTSKLLAAPPFEIVMPNTKTSFLSQQQVQHHRKHSTTLRFDHSWGLT